MRRRANRCVFLHNQYSLSQQLADHDRTQWLKMHERFFLWKEFPACVHNRLVHGVETFLFWRFVQKAATQKQVPWDQRNNEFAPHGAEQDEYCNVFFDENLQTTPLAMEKDLIKVYGWDADESWHAQVWDAKKRMAQKRVETE